MYRSDEQKYTKKEILTELHRLVNVANEIYEPIYNQLLVIYAEKGFQKTWLLEGLIFDIGRKLFKKSIEEIKADIINEKERLAQFYEKYGRLKEQTPRREYDRRYYLKRKKLRESSLNAKK